MKIKATVILKWQGKSISRHFIIPSVVNGSYNLITRSFDSLRSLRITKYIYVACI